MLAIIIRCYYVLILGVKLHLLAFQYCFCAGAPSTRGLSVQETLRLTRVSQATLGASLPRRLWDRKCIFPGKIRLFSAQEPPVVAGTAVHTVGGKLPVPSPGGSPGARR